MNHKQYSNVNALALWCWCLEIDGIVAECRNDVMPSGGGQKGPGDRIDWTLSKIIIEN